MTARYLAYYRVSTQRQGRSGLGLEAQRAEVARLVEEEGAVLDGEVTEVESGKDERNRPLLLEALEQCRKEGTTLLVAKLCRLSRDAAFVLTLMKDSKVRFKVAAMPQADNFQLGIWALLNQQEREQISRRTKEALAAAKARGVKLGGTGGAHASLSGMNAARRRKADEHKATVRPLANHLREQGMTLQAIADTLNASGSRTAAGCEWRPTQVSRVLGRLSSSALS
jgi:DNA invertase Pin-like site-specific DNA recombinase